MAIQINKMIMIKQ